MELEESTCLTSDYTTKLQSSRQYGPGTENRNTDQWNKIDRPEINPCFYGHLNFDKRGKNIQWGQRQLLQQVMLENWTATCKKMKVEHFAMTYTKINSK